MIGRILVPIDGSDVAREALEFALAEFDPDEIVVLNVLEVSDHVDDAANLVLDSPGRESVEASVGEWFEDARSAAAGTDVEITTAIETGTPSQAIVEYADDAGIDLIVMGTHGRTGATRVLLGSVAETVVRRSSVPVLVYR